VPRARAICILIEPRSSLSHSLSLLLPISRGWRSCRQPPPFFPSTSRYRKSHSRAVIRLRSKSRTGNIEKLRSRARDRAVCIGKRKAGSEREREREREKAKEKDPINVAAATPRCVVSLDASSEPCVAGNAEKFAGSSVTRTRRSVREGGRLEFSAKKDTQGDLSGRTTRQERLAREESNEPRIIAVSRSGGRGSCATGISVRRATPPCRPRLRNSRTRGLLQ